MSLKAKGQIFMNIYFFESAVFQNFERVIANSVKKKSQKLRKLFSLSDI